MSLVSSIKALTFEPVPELPVEQQVALLAIRNQQIIRDSSYSSHVIEDSEHFRWIERLQADPTVLFYAVKIDGTLIGGVGLRKIDPEKKTAEWSFYVSEAAHGQGIGLALGICALDLFFNDLSLTTVIGEALTHNPASLAFHDKLGFQQIAKQKHLVQPGNHLADIAVFSLNAAEWLLHRQILCADI